MIHRVFIALAVACATMAFSAGLVLAHAELVRADPADGGTLRETPYTLTLTFDESLGADGSSVVVRDAAGNQVATGGVSDDAGVVMTADLPALPDGRYTAFWTALTPDDGAVERGTISFTVGAASSTPTPSPTTSPDAGAGSGDVLVALAVAAVALGAVIAFLVLRSRR